MAGVAAERQAAKVFRLDEFAFAVMRYSRRVNIVGFSGVKGAAGHGRRQRGFGLFGRRSSCLPVHFRSPFKRLRYRSGVAIRLKLGNAPIGACLYDFYVLVSPSARFG